MLTRLFFGCKMTLRPFTIVNSTILPRVSYEAAVKVEVTYAG